MNKVDKALLRRESSQLIVFYLGDVVSARYSATQAYLILSPSTALSFSKKVSNIADGLSRTNNTITYVR
jgi:hypothetical protein